jgi:sugar lactone lactonase YvrE
MNFRNVFILLPLTVGVAICGLVTGQDAHSQMLYVATKGDTIERFTPTGVQTLFTNTGLNDPYMITFDKSGNLYAANVFGPTVEKFTPNGVGSVFASVGAQGYGHPFGVVFDSAGILYVAADNGFPAGGGGRIQKYAANGVDQGPFAVSGLNVAIGMAFDSAGNLYAANADGNTIEKFSPSGVDLGVFAAGLTTPNGLAFDIAGNLYSTNGDNTIRKFTPGGSSSIFANTGLNDPFGLAFDNAGNLFVANVQGNNIEKFSPSGVDLGVFASGLNQPRGIAFGPSSATPEPGNIAFLVTGGLTSAAFLRRRKARKAD